MAYWGYIGLIKGYLSGFTEEYYPKILEIGVDKGQTFIPLTAHLMKTKDKFQITGVDIKIEGSVAVILEMMSYDHGPDQSAVVVKNNSLNFLQRMQKLIDSDEDYKDWGYWDLILLDGDHNYYTVSRELDLSWKTK